MSTEPVHISTSWAVDTLKTRVLVILDRGLTLSQYVYQTEADQLSETIERIAKKYQTTYRMTMRQGETAGPSGWLRHLMRTSSLDIMLLPDRGELDCLYVEDISEVLTSLIFEESCGGNILNVLTTELDSELVFKLEAALKIKIEMQRKNNGRV